MLLTAIKEIIRAGNNAGVNGSIGASKENSFFPKLLTTDKANGGACGISTSQTIQINPLNLSLKEMRYIEMIIGILS